MKRYTDKVNITVSALVRQTAFAIQRDAKKTLNSPRPGRGPTTNLGLLRDSIKVDIGGEGAATTATVFVGKEYGVWVEFGRRGLKSSPIGTQDKHAARAAWPPFRAILQWVKERRIRPKGGGLGRDKKTGRFIGLAQTDQNSIAFLIQRKIAKHGIQPRPFLMPAYRRHIKGFRERLSIAIGEIKLQ